MRLLRAAAHRRMPWRNGGGETLEVAIVPADAGTDGFDWRVSMAVVATDGPFSRFAGVDRTLVLLDGDGMTLDVAGRPPVSITPDSAPFAFPADVATTARLNGGPITDLNVMTARGRYAHRVERFSAPRDVRVAPLETVLLLGGGAIMAGMTLGTGDVVLLDAGETAHVEPAGAPCLSVTIRRIA